MKTPLQFVKIAGNSQQQELAPLCLLTSFRRFRTRFALHYKKQAFDLCSLHALPAHLRLHTFDLPLCFATPIPDHTQLKLLRKADFSFAKDTVLEVHQTKDSHQLRLNESTQKELAAVSRQYVSPDFHRHTSNFSYFNHFSKHRLAENKRMSTEPGYLENHFETASAYRFFIF